MNINLSGKTALVTGSTAGIGYAIAKGLAHCGATVVINGRKQETVDRSVAALQKENRTGIVHGVAADVSTAEGCARLLAAQPNVDILINNAGIYELKDFFDISDADWTRFFEMNVLSGVRLSRAYMPGMLAADWGRVLFISSESALNIPVDMIHYGFSKTAMLSIARGLAKHAAGTGVTVNAVLPGPTLSDGLKAFLQEKAKKSGLTLEEAAADFVRKHRPSSILQRAATPGEVANMVVYLASPQASATTGASVRVDGGTVEHI